MKKWTCEPSAMIRNFLHSGKPKYCIKFCFTSPQITDGQAAVHEFSKPPKNSRRQHRKFSRPGDRTPV